MTNTELYNDALKTKNCRKQQALKLIGLNRLTLSLKLRGKRKIYLYEAKRLEQLTGLKVDCDKNGYLILKP